jgi:hypothetical protein
VGPEDRSHPCPAPRLPSHHPQGLLLSLNLTRAAPHLHRIVRAIPDFSFFLTAILLFLYRVLQILREIEGDLSGFKCGMAHLFCMYRYTYLNQLMICSLFLFRWFRDVSEASGSLYYARQFSKKNWFFSYNKETDVMEYSWIGSH